MVSAFHLPFKTWPGKYIVILLILKAALDDGGNFLGGCFGHEGFQLPV